VGRPSSHRRAIAPAFVAKAVFNRDSTRQLLDRLAVDVSLRRLRGWESLREIRHESQFSRAFAEFGGRMIRVRGNAKVMCHLMFGIVALDADQILRLIR